MKAVFTSPTRLASGWGITLSRLALRFAPMESAPTSWCILDQIIYGPAGRFGGSFCARGCSQVT